MDAERNIVPEQENDDEILSAVGSEASNLVRKILNYSEYDESFIEIIVNRTSWYLHNLYWRLTI